MRPWLIVLLALAGCRRDESPAPPAFPPVPGQQIQVSDDPHDFSRQSPFKVPATESLYVRVQVPSLPETTMLTIELIDPRGTLFHEEHVPYTRLAEPTMVQDPLMHAPMQAWRAEAVDGGWALIRGIPIRGTDLMRASSTETAWGVVARIDGVPGELSTTVILQP
jgi:hypothetical protein